MRSFRRLFLLAVFYVLLAISIYVEAQPVNAEEMQPPQDLMSDKRISVGRVKFIATCAYCHGQEGDAGKNRSFRLRPADWDPMYIHNTIIDGKRTGSNVMPSWGGSISEDQIRNIVAYIKSLSGKPTPQY